MDHKTIRRFIGQWKAIGFHTQINSQHPAGAFLFYLSVPIGTQVSNWHCGAKEGSDL